MNIYIYIYKLALEKRRRECYRDNGTTRRVRFHPSQEKLDTKEQEEQEEQEDEQEDLGEARRGEKKTSYHSSAGCHQTPEEVNWSTYFLFFSFLLCL